MAEGEGVPHWRRWLVAIWLLTTIVFVVTRWSMIVHFSLPDTDDNMRMAQVRALLDGQGWFDLRQHKLNPPLGYNIHWSRLVDLPIAAIELIVRPFTGGAVAEKVAAAVAPLLPLLLAMYAMALTARRLVAPGAFAIAAGLMIAGQAAMLMFMPMRVDHHGWQLALLCATIAGLSDPDARRGGLVMGLSSAASLVIGLELLPFLAIAGAATALRWVWDAEERPRLSRYGLALAAGCMVGYLCFASYDNRVARCDVLSPVWMSTMVAAGALAYGLSLLPLAGPVKRFGAAAAVGALLIAGFAWYWPQCLGRPEQISPELARLWFDNIREAKPLYAQSATIALSVVALPLAGVAGSLWAAWRAWDSERFARWAPVALVSCVSLLLCLWQTRAGPAAQLMAVPGATALAWHFIPRLAKHRSVLVRTLGVVVAFLLVSGLVVQLVIGWLPGKPASARTQAINRANGRCPSLPAMQALNRFPATTIFTFVDLGPRLITVTHHSAVAGPYHRNGAAILDVHHAFTGSPEQARAIMLRHGATLLLTCPNMNESTVFRARAPRGFYGRLAAGEPFAWLTPVPIAPGSPLLLWRIR